MSVRQRRLSETTAMPPVGELGGHRVRHHGKHHQPHQHSGDSDLWRTTATVAHVDVVNATSTTPAVDRATVCYTTNEVLVIIALTCVLNLAFIVVVMSCVHFCSSPAVAKLSRLESLLLLESATSDSDPELEPRAVKQLLRLSPKSGRRAVEDYLLGLAAPAKGSRSSSMLSLQTLAPEPLWLSSLPMPRHRLDPAVTSFSMENLLLA